ncbi:MAG: hypothetical protein NT067_03195 [Candidatus Diapherotrites archaeon]|nr:hypothetical protein [Candidatus Diapherotrites archaeon]
MEAQAVNVSWRKRLDASYPVYLVLLGSAIILASAKIFSGEEIFFYVLAMSLVLAVKLIATNIFSVLDLKAWDPKPLDLIPDYGDYVSEKTSFARIILAMTVFCAILALIVLFLAVPFFIEMPFKPMTGLKPQAYIISLLIATALTTCLAVFFICAAVFVVFYSYCLLLFVFPGKRKKIRRIMPNLYASLLAFFGNNLVFALYLGFLFLAVLATIGLDYEFGFFGLFALAVFFWPYLRFLARLQKKKAKIQKIRGFLAKDPMTKSLIAFVLMIIPVAVMLLFGLLILSITTGNKQPTEITAATLKIPILKEFLWIAAGTIVFCFGLTQLGRAEKQAALAGNYRKDIALFAFSATVAFLLAWFSIFPLAFSLLAVALIAVPLFQKFLIPKMEKSRRAAKGTRVIMLQNNRWIAGLKPVAARLYIPLVAAHYIVFFLAGWL